MEQILASSTPFVRHSFVSRDDRVADGTFALSLQSASNVLTERVESICYGSILEFVSRYFE